METFNPPKEEPKVEEVEIPELDYSLQHTKFHKEYRFAFKQIGEKIVKKQLPHSMIIGGSKSTCRELLGVGYVAQSFHVNGERLDLGLNNYSNHVWIPDYNKVETDPTRKVIYVCLNCGSMMIGNKFIPYTRLEKQDENKEEIKEEKK